MVLTQLSTAEPANDKLYTAQVYSGVVNQVENLIYDGSFNQQGGEAFGINSSLLWLTTSGNHNYNFTKTNTADVTTGQAMKFNGYSSYIQLQGSPNGFDDIGFQQSLRRLSAMRVSRSTWNTTAMECLAYGKTWYLMINQTPGYMSFYQYATLGSPKLYEVKIPLSSLAAGYHNIVFGYDGNFLYLNIDNGAVQAQAAGGGFSTANLPNVAAFSYLGCFAQNIGTGEQQMYFFTGIIDDFASWNSNATTEPFFNIQTIASNYANGEAWAFQVNQGVTTVQYGGLDYHFTFDNDTTSTCFDLVQGVMGLPKNCTLTTGSLPNSRALYVPLNNPGATAVGFQGNTGISQMLMNLTGSNKYFMGIAILGGNLGGTGTVTISVTDGTHTWSTNLSIAQLNTNSWQNFNWSFIPSNFGLTTNAYVSVQITGNCTGTLFFDHIIVSPGITSPYFDLIYQDPTIRNPYYLSASNVYVGTQYTYAYIKNWTDVGSLPTNSQEVGTLGSQITIQLNRDPNTAEAVGDLKLNNRVYIQYASPNSPGGMAYFDGYIADYTLDFNNNNVSVILISWGQQMANYLLLAGSAPAVQNKFSDQIYTPSRYAIASQVGTILAVKTAPGQETITGLNLYMQTSQAGQTDVLTVALFTSLSNAAGFGGANTENPNNVQYATAYVVDNITYQPNMQQVPILFNSPVKCSPNTTYYFCITSQLSAAAGGVGFLASQPQLDANSQTYAIAGVSLGNNGTSLLTGLTLQYDLLGGNNSATVLYTQQDPAAILKSAINNLRAQGANIQYTASSIDTVGQPVTYEFQTATGNDVMNTVPTLCPPGWYTYVDQSTNTVHLHAYASRTVHKLLLGSHINQLTFEKRMDTMVNTIYFTGGADTANPGFNIFRFYQNAGSVQLYGVRMKTVSDNRVTLAQTADIVAQSYLNVNPEIRTTITVTDKAYNIDSFLEGDLINFGNFQNGKTANWDQKNWGISSPQSSEGYWDFDITSPETLYLYIERIDYLIDTVQLTLSTTPPEVNKKLQATLNSLNKTQTLANPPTPTEGTNLIT